MAKATVGERVREAREHAKLDRPTLADMVGVHVGSVNRWESSGAEPTDANLRKIAEATGRPFEWLKEGEGHEGEPRDRFYTELRAVLARKDTTVLDFRAAVLELALLFRSEALAVQERSAARAMEDVHEERTARRVPADQFRPAGSISSRTARSSAKTSDSDSKG